MSALFARRVELGYSNGRPAFFADTINGMVRPTAKQDIPLLTPGSPDPRNRLASQMVAGDPPDASTFLSCPPLKNPMNLLSGDQKGEAAPSVPCKGCAMGESSGRTHKAVLPSRLAAM